MRFQGSLIEFDHRQNAFHSQLSRVSRVLVISTIILSSSGCSVGGKSWSDLLDEGRKAIKNQDYASAETSLQAAVAAAQKKFGQNAGQTATCMTDLAELYVARQEYRKASKTFKELIPIWHKIEPGSADESRVVAEYNEVKGKIKNYKLEPDEVSTDEAKDGKTEATPGSTAGDKSDASKSDDSKAVETKAGAKVDSAATKP